MLRDPHFVCALENKMSWETYSRHYIELQEAKFDFMRAGWDGRQRQ